MTRALAALAAISLLLSGCGRSDPDTSATPAPWSISPEYLHPDIRSIYSDPHFGPLCGTPLMCNYVVSIDCGSAVDGPRNYYNNLTGEVIMYCGGACMAPVPGDPRNCTACPPPQWTCPTYLP
jgi:hypothetical protein